MPLSVGEKLGPYEILAPLGAGGMGEVFKATDTRLHRTVAIKILPHDKVVGPERKRRFMQEARAASALNHPNIITLHDIASDNGMDYMVMEYVPGKSLDKFITSKGMPLAEGVDYVRQIAAALAAAHAAGIVHRDIKPSNVMISAEGHVKVLDFGLAKLEERSLDPEDETRTVEPKLTETGVVMGTVAYMSPEQASAMPVDYRTDIFSLGVVLYEMLAGRRPFRGKSPVETMHAIINESPPPLDNDPPDLQAILDKALAKDPKARYHHAGDLALDLTRLLNTPKGAARGASFPGGAPRGSAWGWIAGGVLAVVAVGLGFVHLRERRPEPRLITTTILPPDDTTFNFNSDNPLAISPDGKRIVYGVRSNGGSKLWMRQLDSPAAQPLDGTENAQFPFWSPDSKSIGFFADRKLKRIDVAGGAALPIADTPIPRGGAWSPDDTIVYSPTNPGGLQRVAAAGGTPSPATAFNAASDRSHRFPWFLPDGRHFLFEDQLQLGSNDDVLRIGSLDSKEIKTIGPSNSNAMYAQGYLLFLHENTLVAQPFDENRLVTTGDAEPIGERVQTAVPAGSVGVFCVSRDGLLVYQTGSGGTGLQLTWFDRTGKPMGTLGEAGNVFSLEFSPDRKSVAVALTGQNSALWIYDAARGLRSRFTFDPGVEREARWAPDERSIVYSSDQKGHSDLYRKPTDLNGNGEVLYADGAPKNPSSWSRDGKFLLFTRNDPKTADGIWVLPMTPDTAGKPFPFLQTPFDESNARFSPDGKWVAYVSYESGRPEIYVAPFPGPGGKRQISTAGGLHARWRDDGKELFYAGPGGIVMAAEIVAKGGSIEVGAVRSLGIPTVTTRGWTYDVTADGQRFLVAARPEQKSSEPLTLVSNWTLLLKK